MVFFGNAVRVGEALLTEAEVSRTDGDFRVWHEADMPTAPLNVRCWGRPEMPKARGVFIQSGPKADL